MTDTELFNKLVAQREALDKRILKQVEGDWKPRYVPTEQDYRDLFDEKHEQSKCDSVECTYRIEKILEEWLPCPGCESPCFDNVNLKALAEEIARL